MVLDIEQNGVWSRDVENASTTGVQNNPSLIPVSDRDKWQSVLRACGNHDVYHLAALNQFSQEHEPGSESFLFYYAQDDVHAAVPILIRPLPEKLGGNYRHLRDAASAYGYPGVICSVENEKDTAADFRDNFHSAFQDALKARDVITLFLRGNPLIDRSWLTRGLGEQILLGKTVALDLSLSDEQQRSQASKRHRNDYRKAVSNGVTISQDPDFRLLDTFVQLYSQTMTAANASDFYFFDKPYFENLKRHLGENVSMFHVHCGERIVGSTVVFMTDGIIQYHLGGWALDTGNLSPLRILVEHLRLWGKENGYRWVHLGGGVGARDDSLLRFKRSFSKSEFDYYISRVIVDQSRYDSVCAAAGCDIAQDGFFPAYRGS